jgi:small subunit ribosomal protein S17
MADEKKTTKTKAEETEAVADPETPAAEEKPKRTRKKAEEAAAEPAEAPVVAEEVEAEADQVEAAPEPEPEAAPEPVAEEAPAEEAAPAEEPALSEEPVAEEPAAEEVVAEETVAEVEPPPDVEAEAAAAEEPVAAEPAADEAVAAEGVAAPPVTDEAATEQPRGPQRGPKKKSKRLPRSERHRHAKPKREPAKERSPIVRLPKPEGERGREQQRRGVVVSAAMDKTIVVRVDSVKAHPRYKKVIRRSVKFHAHDERNEAKAGDVVRIVETRPLSKTKRWRLAEILEVAK